MSVIAIGMLLFLFEQLLFTFLYQHKNCSREHIENVAYTIKEVNAVVRKTLFRAVAICPPNLMSSVKDVWEKAVENCECVLQRTTPARRKVGCK